MIQVRYKGRLGNNLFQYCYGRILAEELGYELDADPIEGFPGTFETVPGKELNGPAAIIISGYQYPDPNEFILDPPQVRIVVNAYLQVYRYYARYMDRIKQWLRLEPYEHKTFSSDEETIVVSLRLGDYFPLGWVLSPDYYIQIIESNPFRKLIIVTDSPRSNYLQNFSRFRPQVVHDDPLSDFKWLVNASRLIISQSTFSWWGAMLSNAEVWMPETSNSLWSRRYTHMDLRVIDRPTWHIVNADVLPRDHNYVESL